MAEGQRPLKIGSGFMGPLAGLRVVEFAGIGPGPFGAMLLADLGADVLRIDRVKAGDPGVAFEPKFDLLNRNKRSIALDLKSENGKAAALELAMRAEILIEGFRPGVMEGLGLGPDICCALNPKLVYGRMTGWGQDGPLAKAAGHDLNYIALTGALDAIGRAGEPPTIPLNLLGDFAGGSLYLAFGLLAAVIEARVSGKGQVVDANILDGTASLMTMLVALRQMGAWKGGRGENILDGGAPFYAVYETSDGLWISIASLEAKFYAELLERLGLAGEELPLQNDAAGHERLGARFAAVFKTRTRTEWIAALEGTDVCFAPVLHVEEAMRHPHLAARKIFVEKDGVTQPAPAPRFSRTPGTLRNPPPSPGADGRAALMDWGFSDAEIDALEVGAKPTLDDRTGIARGARLSNFRDRSDRS